ncbi:MAG: M28 family peptidase [Pirellulales bacterium]|nr:M28 family peptidase [Pirellulales bacterium]
MQTRISAGLLVLAACVLCASPAFAQFEGASPITADLKTGFETITEEQAEDWLSLLAGPKFQGRGTGQTGYTKAAFWVAGKAAEFGLEPKGEGNTYFQYLPMTKRSVDPTQTTLTGPNGLVIEAKGNLGFDRTTDVPQVAGKVVFLTMKGNVRQMPEGIDLRDKFVIYTADRTAQRRASFVIGRAGPVAALQVTEGEPVYASQLVRGGRRGRGGSSIGGTISRDAAVKLIEAVSGDTDWLDVEKAEGTESHAVDAEVSLQLRVREESAGAPNVLAWLPGSDPELRDEFIIIGAHLDHLGMRGDTVYPGADDNGSGSTAILSIARAMTENPVKPKRSILFMWFTGEEIGLLGSAHFANNPTLPLENAVCMFNMDMIGRDEETENETAEENRKTLHLIGSKRGDPDLHETLMDANKFVNFEFEYDQESVFGRSDQASFYRKGLSVAFVFGGFHPDYHQPTDKPAKINYNKIASTARFFYVALHMAAEHGKYDRVDVEEK